ncbi:9704_t:CDS:2 [Paraglomus brasilianum]|uniref:9704_t:CDS:1 n=1 Tax=Paraglomus brasilianum TaxID=144538 RepID=A0A9N9DK93_9GLOM|nr:9704_t:CDS:2 [Paraglomus brasilianum]
MAQLPAVIMAEEKRRKKPLSSMTMLKKDLQAEERSSLKDGTVFSKTLDSGKEYEEDFMNGMELEEGSPYHACALHSSKEFKTFQGQKILSKIEEIVSDEEEPSPN